MRDGGRGTGDGGWESEEARVAGRGRLERLRLTSIWGEPLRYSGEQMSTLSA